MGLFSHAKKVLSNHKGAAIGGLATMGLGASLGAVYDKATEKQKTPNLGAPVTDPSMFTGAAQQQQQQNAATDQWRQGYLNDINQNQQNRGAYAQALGQQFVQAANPGAQTANADAMQQNVFNQARHGTSHGSADFTAQGHQQANYASQLAQIMSQGQALTRGQQSQDAAQAQAMRNQAFGVGPGEQLATQSQLDASRARMGQTSAQGQLGLQGIQDQAGYQQLLSQILGGQMSTGAGVINAAGRTGTGSPWAQALGQYLAGGSQ